MATPVGELDEDLKYRYSLQCRPTAEKVEGG